MIPLETATTRKLAPISQSQGGKEEPEKPMPVESVRFTFPSKPDAVLTLKVADFQSGKAMLEAAQEWGTKAPFK